MKALGKGSPKLFEFILMGTWVSVPISCYFIVVGTDRGIETDISNL